jgi:Uma2 family endonuclease
MPFCLARRSILARWFAFTIRRRETGIMSVLAEHLTLEEFRAFEQSRLDGPRYEYWEGKAVPKAIPNKLHARLQQVLLDLFETVGYSSYIELELRISPTWQPKPDVAALLIDDDEPYPTKPFDIVAEVLSPSDEPAEVLEKCRHYQELRIEQIFVFDPQRRTARQWDALAGELKDITTLELTNGNVLPVEDVWLALDKKLKKTNL